MAIIDTMKAWQCIGCGRLEAPQNCIGVCRDRKVELVYASELADAEGRLDRAHDEIAALRAFIRKLAGTRPRAGQWERSWTSLQGEAKDLLAKHADAPAAGPGPVRAADVPGEAHPREA